MRDNELIERVRAGDRDAYGVLLTRYQGRIFALCHRMTGNALDAEDLTHEAFVEAYVKLHQLRDPERFGAWLRTLALNLCRMWYRRRYRHREALADYRTLEGNGAEDADDADEVRAQLAWGLGRLSAGHRMVLVLHYLEGLSYADMATFLQVPIGTVMSRLHRARLALKAVMDEQTENEEVDMNTEDRIREEVDAEIAVLLELFREDPSAMERLSVILAQSPERFRDLVAEANEDAQQERLARLLPRLGPPAIQAALTACVAPDEQERTNASAVLCAALAYDTANRPGASGWAKTPSRFSYLLMDALIASSVEESAKATTLADLLEACPDEWVAVLIMNVAMTYEEAAYPILFERLWNAGGQGSSYVLQALSRMGTRFCEGLLAELSSESESRHEMALKGFEAVARAIDPPWLADATERQWAEDVRTRTKWAPLRRGALHESVLSALVERTVGFLNHPADALRNTAIRILGQLRSAQHADALRACPSHDRPTTRVAAIHALAEIAAHGDLAPGTLADAMLDSARDEEASVRRAAVDALGRLHVEAAFPVLEELLSDREQQVRTAALNALSDLGTEPARAAVAEARNSSDKALRRAAAKLSCRPPQQRPLSELTRERMQRFGLDGSPVTHISVTAAIRWALPEVRLYEHADLTQRIAQVCGDYSATRRYLIEIGLMERDNGTYELTDFGKAVWRVERHIRTEYLGL